MLNRNQFYLNWSGPNCRGGGGGVKHNFYLERGRGNGEGKVTWILARKAKGCIEGFVDLLGRNLKPVASRLIYV